VATIKVADYHGHVDAGKEAASHEENVDREERR
jgi:hypothetical protein